MKKIRVYGYRWVVLSLLMLVTALIEAHWINFAPITNEAAAYYGVTQMQVGYFAMCYMFIFLIMCIPASYILDRFGIRIGIGTGAVLMAVSAAVKGAFPSDYTAVLAAQIGLAVAQPFIINSGTMLAARWFPVNERGTATGLAMLAQYLGIIACMVLTPMLYKSWGMEKMLSAYAVVSVAAALIFVLLMREKPKTPPSEFQQVDSFHFMESIRVMVSSKDMILLFTIFFFGIGMFNAVTSWIEPILSPRGFNGEQAGLVAAAMMGGGVVGAIVFPLLSDVLRKRKLFILVTMIGTVPGLVGVTFLPEFYTLLAASFIFGLFIMAAAPIGFQYAAEITYPVPEASSQGLILFAGQISGILFMFGMDYFRGENGSMTPSMIAFIIFITASVFLAALLKESTMIGKDASQGK